MRKSIKAAISWAAQLLLCLLIFGLLGCSSLKNGNNEVTKEVTPLLQVAIKESDFSLFNERMQQLGLIAIDFQPARMNEQNGEIDCYWMTFRFLDRRSFLAGSSAIISIGLAYQISYEY